MHARRCLAALILLAATVIATAQSLPASEGGDYRLSRTRVASGTAEAQSSEASPPRYRLQATVGQAEAEPDPATSPRYRLRGGFWAARGIGAPPSNLFEDGFED